MTNRRWVAVVLAVGVGIAAVAACGPVRVVPVNDATAATGTTAGTALDERAVCRNEEPEVPGNRLAWFLSDVGQGRDPLIQGGVENPWRCAYDQLCLARRAEITEAAFRESGGEALWPALKAGSWYGVPRVEERNAPNRDQLQPPGPPADAPDGTTTWRLVDLIFSHREGEYLLPATVPDERWRMDFVREGGRWRVCGFERSDVPVPTTTTPSTRMIPPTQPPQ